jgi:hypothetical protein
METDVIVVILLMAAAFILGGFAHSWYVHKFRDYSGTIVVEYDELQEKTVYSLVLDEYPDKLEFKKVVVFKVDVPDHKPVRE